MSSQPIRLVASSQTLIAIKNMAMSEAEQGAGRNGGPALDAWLALYAAVAGVMALSEGTNNPMSDNLREQLAAYAHDAWSGWMRYMLSKCEQQSDGSVNMPAWAVERWTRQMNTPYADLPENEKASDRAEADKMIAMMEAEEQRVVVVEEWESVPFQIGNISFVNPPEGDPV